tara:strand:- start:1260 stop:1493 length:234 start_codon:yes stop_codon:yes gene_type:complete
MVVSTVDRRAFNSGEHIPTVRTSLRVCRVNAQRAAAWMDERARVYSFDDAGEERYGFRLSGDSREIPDGWALVRAYK